MNIFLSPQIGSNGPMRPMGPPGMMPPPHPIQMEMHNIRGQLNHLYSQPPNPQIQQQVKCIFRICTLLD